MSKHRLTTDARNRSLRTFLQGLGFTVLAAVVMVLYPIVRGAHGWGDLHWSLIGFALLQSAGMAVFAYLMRTVLDPSRIPTPLPPADPGEPDDDAPKEAR
jgi:ABC-type amino acid transport system permease subunit